MLFSLSFLWRKFWQHFYTSLCTNLLSCFKTVTKISQAFYFGSRHEKLFTWHLAYGRHFQGDAHSSFWHAGSHSQRYSELRSYPKCRSSREGVELLLQSSSLRWYCYPRHASLNNRKTSVDRSCIPRRTTFKRWKPSPKSALPYHTLPRRARVLLSKKTKQKVTFHLLSVVMSVLCEMSTKFSSQEFQRISVKFSSKTCFEGCIYLLWGVLFVKTGQTPTAVATRKPLFRAVGPLFLRISETRKFELREMS